MLCVGPESEPWTTVVEMCRTITLATSASSRWESECESQSNIINSIWQNLREEKSRKRYWFLWGGLHGDLTGLKV